MHLVATRRPLPLLLLLPLLTRRSTRSCASGGLALVLVVVLVVVRQGASATPASAACCATTCTAWDTAAWWWIQGSGERGRAGESVAHGRGVPWRARCGVPGLAWWCMLFLMEPDAGAMQAVVWCTCGRAWLAVGPTASAVRERGSGVEQSGAGIEEPLGWSLTAKGSYIVTPCSPHLAPLRYTLTGLTGRAYALTPLRLDTTTPATRH
mgnify:CR=1 FL=1